jgi:hypothetical protein
MTNYGNSPWTDSPLPEDEAIRAAHPLRTTRHDLYQEAQRFVGARHSKVGLVDLVNWLLLRIDTLSDGQAIEKRYTCVKCGAQILAREVASAVVTAPDPVTDVIAIIRLPPGGPTCANLTACRERQKKTEEKL